MTRVELFEVIRRGYFIDRKSKRALSREHGVHRRDVRRAVTCSVPPQRKQPERDAPVLGRHKAVIDGWLRDDVERPRKQRHTARRIWQRLVAERDCTAAESTVRRYVGRRKRELGLTAAEVYIEQEYQPGEEAQVDFGEADVVLAGVQITVQLLLVRCCFSGKTFVAAFHRATQQAFLQGLAEALSFLGGVFERMRFDNLSSAVRRVLRGRRRCETERFVAFRSHYLFESAFCRPGIEGAHEKGGVEGEVGRFRRQHLVPLPEHDDIDALNVYLHDCCDTDESRRVTGQSETVGERWAASRAKLRALPDEPFDTTVLLHPVVDQKSRAKVLRNFYSVPTRYARRRIEARVSANAVTLYADGKSIAVHARRFGVYEESLVLDHYLEWLRRKPGSMARSKVLGQARRAGAFPPCYERLCRELVTRYGDAEGTRQLVDVLLLLRDADEDAVTMAVELALAYGCIDGQAVAYLLRQLLAPARPDNEPLCDLGDLALYERREPDIAKYDRWLVRSSEVH